MGHKLHIRLAASAVIILALVALELRHNAPYFVRNMMPKQPPAVVLAMEDVNLVGLGHNGRLWSARADRVEIGRDHYTARLSKIRDAKIYADDQVVLTARAGKALYQTCLRNLTLDGGVEIIGSDGQRVTGKGAIWNSSTSSLRSIGGVSFQTKWGTAYAGSLVADLKNEELKMWNVSMKIRLNEIENGAKQEAQ